MTQEPLVIRPLRKEDVEAVCSLHRRAILQAYTKRCPPHVLQDWAAARTPEGYLRNQAKGENFLVAIYNDKPVGFIGWKKGELCGLYVDPDYHQRGIGSMLVRNADIKALETNEPILFVDANPEAQGFYKKHGFHFVREDTCVIAGHTVPNIYMER